MKTETPEEEVEGGGMQRKGWVLEGEGVVVWRRRRRR